MKMKFKLIAIAIVLISLTGCITYKAVGKFENYDEVFIGNVNHRILLGGGGTFDITAVNSGVSCTGTAYKPDKIPFNFDCSGQEGNGDGVCTDGKTIKMRWYASSCKTGYGKGTTSDGIIFNFAFGLTQDDAMVSLDKLATEAVGKKSYAPTKQKEELENQSVNIDEKTKQAEEKCMKLGIKSKTEKFNKCVLENSR
jgi:hypothetical protein